MNQRLLHQQVLERLGALVLLVDSDEKYQRLFLGQDGGSMKLGSEAPLGKAILGKCVGDWVREFGT